MKATLLGNSAALAMVLTVLSGSAWADLPQSPEEMVKAMSEAGKPGPEHAKLEPLVGSWTYTGKFWMDPSKPPVMASPVLKIIKSRDEVRIESDDKVVMESYLSEDGKEAKMMEIVAIRKK